MADFNKDQIKELLSGMRVEFDDHLIDRLSQGFESPKLDNVRCGEDDYKDGTVRIFKDNKGNVKIDFNPIYPKMDIPLQLIGHKLTEEEKEELEKTNKVQITKKGKTFDFVIDPTINEVIVKGENPITKMEAIGGYKLSKEEQEKVLNGDKIGPKVLFDPKTDQYIMASFELTEDKKGIKFHGVKEISKKEVQALIEKFNQPKLDNSLQTTSMIGEAVIEKGTEKQIKKEGVEIDSNISDSSKAIAYIQAKDQESLIVMMDNNPSLKDDKEFAKNVFDSAQYIELSAVEKISVNKMIGQTPEGLATSMSDQELSNVLGASPKLDKLTELVNSRDFSKEQITNLSNYINKNKDSLSEENVISLKASMATATQKTLGKDPHNKKMSPPTKTKSMSH